jgi:hypothetical protein
MFAFLLGYSWAGGGVRRGQVKALLASDAFRVKPYILVVLSTFLLIAMVVQAGGVEQVWASDLPRGFGQFATRDAVGKLSQMVAVLAGAAGVVVATVASVVLLRNRALTAPWWVGIFSLVVALLPGIWAFSRGAGAPLGIFAFIAFRLGTNRSLTAGVGALFLAWNLGQIGLNERGNYYPGVGNFLAAVISDESDLQRHHRIRALPFGPADNPLEAVSAWTRKAQQRKLDDPDGLASLISVLWHLNPVPSEFTGLPPIGRDLAKVMGTFGSTGLTSPLLADLFYAFGYLGSVFMLLIGAVCGWFEKQARTSPGLDYEIGVVLCLIGLGIGSQLGLRAATRPLFYALVLVWITRKGGNHEIPSGRPVVARSTNNRKVGGLG